MNDPLYFMFMGFLGGASRGLIWSEKWSDIKKFKFCKYLLLGGISGFLYFFLYNNYNFPNFIMSFVSGYTGSDFIVGVSKRVGGLRRLVDVKGKD